MQNCRSFLPQAPKFAAEKKKQNTTPPKFKKDVLCVEGGLLNILRGLFEGGGNTPPKTNKKRAISIGQDRLN